MPLRRALLTSDQTATSPQVEDLEPCIPAVLLQRVGLDRANPHRAYGTTTRTTVLYARGCWAFCSSLRKLSVQDFHSQVRDGLHDLPLDPTLRLRLCEQLTPLLDVRVFWHVVEQADGILREVEANTRAWSSAGENIWNGQFFRTRFTGQPRAAAATWGQTGLEVLTTLDAIRTYAHGLINQRARFLQLLWQQGNFMAVLAACQEQLPVQWVHDAVAAIAREVNEGATPAIRRHARAQLRQIAAAGEAVGKGRLTRRTAEATLIAKRKSVSHARSATHLLAYYERLRASGFDHTAALRCTVERFQHSDHLTDPDEKKQILARFSARLQRTQENLP